MGYRIFLIFKAVFYLAILTGIASFIYQERHYLSAIYEVIHFEELYYEKKVTSDGIQYLKTKNRPKDWIELKDISKNIRGAMIVSEDGKFYHHPGYDLESLRDRVYDTFVLKKKELKGGSTITQQLVKNLYLSSDRTLGRKSRELFLAILIEKYASKDHILEAYLNIIEYGKDLYGIEAASKFYFKKIPAKVSAREAAFLAMLLPNPKRYSRSFSNKILSNYARKTVDSILLRMRQNAFISENEYSLSLSGAMSFEKQMREESFSDKASETSGLDYNSKDREDLAPLDKDELQSSLSQENKRI